MYLIKSNFVLFETSFFNFTSYILKAFQSFLQKFCGTESAVFPKC